MGVNLSNKMIITEELISSCNHERLIELVFLQGLPTSQAIAVHLIDDLGYRPSEAARLLSISQIAISDSLRKGRSKQKCYFSNIDDS